MMPDTLNLVVPGSGILYLQKVKAQIQILLILHEQLVLSNFRDFQMKGVIGGNPVKQIPRSITLLALLGQFV